MTGLYSILVLN